MKVAPLFVLASLAFLLVPSASAQPLPCIDTGSQWGACYSNGCVVVDGAALHEVYCVGDAIGDLVVCTPGVSQWRACVGAPCSTLDGAALHKVVCLPSTA